MNRLTNDSTVLHQHLLLSFVVGILVVIASCSSTPVTIYRGFSAVVNGDTIHADTAYYIRATGGTYITALKAGKERFYFILGSQGVGQDSINNGVNYATYTDVDGKKYKGISGIVTISQYEDNLGSSSFIKGTFNLGFLATDSSIALVKSGRMDTIYRR
jgi:hypothetical protein